MKLLYLECAAGVSGDMAAGALLDLGGDRAAVERAVRSLGLDGFSLSVGRVRKSGIDCCDFNVALNGAYENHDHDMAYLYGMNADAEHAHERERHEHAGVPSPAAAHDAAAAHAPEETHGLSRGAHHHEHRSYADIKNILARADMTPSARAVAAKVFRVLAEAEAKAHAVPADEVHFHEVGAVDSIVDIVSCAVLFDSLHVDGAVISALSEGTGNVRCQHGVLPVPVPAVVNIVQNTGLVLSIHRDWKGERVTPTGAAFAAAIRTEDALPEHFRVVGTGYGAGKRDYAPASILRAFLIEPVCNHMQKETAADPAPAVPGKVSDRMEVQKKNTLEGLEKPFPVSENASDEDGETGIWKLETNIDDSTGEQLGFVMDRLMTAGARDVHFTPCFMKKNRPAYMLSVITDDTHREALEDIIFRETTTIGIRRWRVARTCLAREILSVVVEGIPVRLKVTRRDGRARAVPEYGDVVKLCGAAGMPYEEAYERVLAAGEAAVQAHDGG